MTAGRQHSRIKDNLPVHWSIEGGVSGDGVLLDLSSTGIRLITNKSFDPSDNCIFTVGSFKGEQLPFGPQKAILRWSQKVMKNKVECVVCGLEFI